MADYVAAINIAAVKEPIVADLISSSKPKLKSVVVDICGSALFHIGQLQSAN